MAKGRPGDTTKRDIKDTFQDRLRIARDYTAPYFDRFIENYKHYLAHLIVPEGQEYPFSSQMTVPLSYSIVETVIPRMLGKDPEFTATARNPEDIWLESIYRPLSHYWWTNPVLYMEGAPPYYSVFRALKECFVTGTGILMPTWRREMRKRNTYKAGLDIAGINFGDQRALKVAQMFGIKPQWKTVPEDYAAIDDPDVYYVPIWKFLVPPGYETVGDMPWVIREFDTNWTKLQKMAKINNYDLKEIEADIATGKVLQPTRSSRNDYESDFRDLFASTDQRTRDTTINRMTGHEMWEDDHLVVMINERYKIYDGPNPLDVQKKPFLAIHDVPIPFEFYAWGEVDPIKQIEDGMTDMMNMRFDNVVQALLKMWVVNPELLIDENELVPTPGGVVHTRDINQGVRQLDAQDVTAGSYREAGQLLQIAQMTSGVYDYARGEESGSQAGKTLGGLRLLQEAANARFMQKMRLFENLGLRVLANFWIEMSRQYVTEERTLMITGDTGTEALKISPDVLRANKGTIDIDVVPMSTQAVDQQFDVLKWNAVIDRIGKPPFDNLPQDVLDKMAQKYWEAYGIKEARYWIASRKKFLEERAMNPSPPLMTPTSPEALGQPPGSKPPEPVSEPFITSQGQVTTTPTVAQNGMKQAEKAAAPTVGPTTYRQ